MHKTITFLLLGLFVGESIGKIIRLSPDCLNGLADRDECCRRVPNSWYTHLKNPEDCSTYYQCDNGVPVLRPCPSGLEWSVQKNSCDYPEIAKCTTGTGPTNPPSTEEPITTAAPTEKPTTTTAPTKEPTTTAAPTEEPTTTATPTTTVVPTEEPTTTAAPTEEPTTTAAPTEEPTTTAAPTEEPTTTAAPTEEPTTTAAPTEEPTTTAAPTEEPTTTAAPTEEPEITTTEAPATTEPSENDREYKCKFGLISAKQCCRSVPSWKTVLLQNNKNCHTYYKCVKGQPRLLSCNKKYWNANKGKCDSYEKSTCNRPEEPSTTSVPTEEPTTTVAPTEEPTTTAAPTEAPTTTAASTEEPTTTTAPTEEPTTTAAPTEEPTTTAAPTEEPTTTTAPTEEPEITTTEAPVTTEPSENDREHKCKFGLISAKQCCRSVPSWKTVLLQNNKNCHTYYKCVKGRPHLHSCNKKYWNANKGKCDSYEKSTCNRIEEPSTTSAPTEKPTTAAPTEEPTTTAAPTEEPTTTAAPTEEPTTTTAPTEEPTTTAAPTEEPTTTATPTEEPTTTAAPTEEPTTTTAPTEEPTTTAVSTEEPTTTAAPTEEPTTTAAPTEEPEIPTTEAPATTEPSENDREHKCKFGLIGAKECCRSVPFWKTALLQNNKNCQSYYKCVLGRPFLLSCSKKHWNANQEKCGSIEESTCNRTEEPSTTSAPTTTVSPTEEPTTTAAPTEEPTTTAAPTQAPTTTTAPTEEPSTTVATTEEPEVTTTEVPTTTEANSNESNENDKEYRCKLGLISAKTCCRAVPFWKSLLLQNNKNCRTYYKCRMGKAVLHHCPRYLYWNANTEKCVKRQKATCTKRSF